MADWLVQALSVVGLAFLRLGVPLAALALVVFLFQRRELARWSTIIAGNLRHPEQLDRQSQLSLQALKQPCFALKGCTAEAMQHCACAQKPQAPCWMIRGGGRVASGCPECSRYQQARALASSL